MNLGVLISVAVMSSPNDIKVMAVVNVLNLLPLIGVHSSANMRKDPIVMATVLAMWWLCKIKYLMTIKPNDDKITSSSSLS